jgi:hypothetical protein
MLRIDEDPDLKCHTISSVSSVPNRSVPVRFVVAAIGKELDRAEKPTRTRSPARQRSSHEIIAVSPDAGCWAT